MKTKKKARKSRARVLVEYSHNNSGGHWWLTDDDWRELEKAGWKVEWYGEKANQSLDSRRYQQTERRVCPPSGV